MKNRNDATQFTLQQNRTPQKNTNTTTDYFIEVLTRVVLPYMAIYGNGHIYIENMETTYYGTTEQRHGRIMAHTIFHVYNIYKFTNFSQLLAYLKKKFQPSD